MDKRKIFNRIEINPQVMVGKPVVAGTRISVEFLLELLSSGWTYEQIIKDYKITKQDILAAIDYARETVKETQAIPFSQLSFKP